MNISLDKNNSLKGFSLKLIATPWEHKTNQESLMGESYSTIIQLLQKYIPVKKSAN